MPYAKIIIKNFSPDRNTDFIPLDTVFSFFIIPNNSEEIDISTLEISVKIDSDSERQTYNFTNSSSNNITITGTSTNGYDVTLDVFPSFFKKFDSDSDIDIKINVKNTDGLSMKEKNFSFKVLSISNLESFMDLLSEVTEISVYSEQGRIDKDGYIVNFTWKNWSLLEDPVIYKNDIQIKNGFTINKKEGKLVFANQLRTGDPVDVITADYKHGAFTQEQMVGFMNQGLSLYNSYPRQTSYVIRNSPYYARAAVEIGGAYFALSAILNQLINQQTSIRWGEKEDLSRIEGILKSNMTEYKSIVDKMGEAKLKILASSKFIVMPTFNLPGGRSRFFRNVFTSGGAPA
jgi:hypothetical protein